LEKLIQIALLNHPEVAARGADVTVNEIRLREAKVRPLVPLLSVGYSAGRFGGGSDQADTRLGHFSGRGDFDVLAVWTLENLGWGNCAEQRRLQAQVGEAEAQRARVIDRIRREVAEAVALSAARLQEMEVARRRVETATRAYWQDLLRTRNLEGRPGEVWEGRLWRGAPRRDRPRPGVAYTQAHSRLLVARGQPP